MKELVCGFLFLRGNEVVLIQKDKPDWMKGKLNGIGGHVEESDYSPLHAMQREWKEETGETRYDWEQFLVIAFRESLVYFFKASDSSTTARTAEREMVVFADVASLDKTYMTCRFGSEKFYIEPVANLRYLIPMAQSGDKGEMKQ
jgi:8-oxo-dGTP pyrophosphatase MutT (NUDIX family)